MAVTLSVVKRVVAGNERVSYVDITGPASYTTAGEALTAADLAKLTGVPGTVIGNINSFTAEVGNAGHGMSLDRAASKVSYWNGTTQIAALTNLSAVTIRARVAYVSN